MTRTPNDRDRIERSTREALSTIATERAAREAKTARLREQRLAHQASEPPVEKPLKTARRSK